MVHLPRGVVTYVRILLKSKEKKVEHMHNHMMTISRNFYFHYFHNKKLLIYLLDAKFYAILRGFVVVNESDISRQ